MNKRIPAATYRLQFNRDFTFAQAGEIVDYLRDLGITDCYASPLFKAWPQSTHGYDVCDFNQLNPNLGAAEDFERFVARLREVGMGLLLDMVPNHMSTGLSNPWWFDVLENGPASKYASYFDIDWERFKDGKLLLPVLEDELEPVLTAGKLRLISEVGKVLITYYDRRFPLSPASCAMVSKEIARRGADAALNEFNGIPGQPASFARLRDLLEQQHYRLAYWRTGSQQINYRRFFDVSELISLRMELPEVFEATHRLLSTLVKDQKITGLRIDHPDGLWDPKQYLERLQEKVGAIYVVVEKILTDDEALPEDWPADGTTGYDFLNRLNGVFVNQANQQAFDRIYSEFIGREQDFGQMVYQTKKRILESSFPSELNALSCRLDETADSIQHDRSYDSNDVLEVLVEILACFPVYRTYVTEETTRLSPVEKEYIDHAIGEARLRLSERAPRPLCASKDARHYSTVPEQASVAKGAASSLPVPKGRTKIAQRFNVGITTSAGPSPEGTAEENASWDDQALGFIHDLLLLRTPENLDESAKQQCRRFVMRFQQLSGPLMAKGLEDTTFYNFNRLISLNEVGGNPASFGNSIDSFHQHNLQKAARWPHSLLATATHDTKRGEDVRARINVLSEIPDEWRASLNRWRELNACKKSIIDGRPAPDTNDEYFFYQTLLGAWPGGEFQNPAGIPPQSPELPGDWATFRQRVVACMLKSIKESKAHTSWTQPNPAYENATKSFVERTLADSSANAFLADFKAFQSCIAVFARLNSLSQTLLKLTAPGVPDFYQGAELWDLNLVDPDNRRPVDYKIRRQILADLKARAAEGSGARARLLGNLLHDDQLGRSKLYLIWRVLEFRNHHRALFDAGAYIPLTAVGNKKEHICAFARLWENELALVIVPRLLSSSANAPTGLQPGPEIWGDTAVLLPKSSADRRFLNVLTDETLEILPGAQNKIPVSSIFATFPVALIISRSANSSGQKLVDLPIEK